MLPISETVKLRNMTSFETDSGEMTLDKFQEIFTSQYGKHFIKLDKVVDQIDPNNENCLTDELGLLLETALSDLHTSIEKCLNKKFCFSGAYVAVNLSLDNTATSKIGRCIDRISDIKNDSAVNKFANKLIGCSMIEHYHLARLQQLAVRGIKIKEEEKSSHSYCPLSCVLQ